MSLIASFLVDPNIFMKTVVTHNQPFLIMSNLISLPCKTISSSIY